MDILLKLDCLFLSPTIRFCHYVFDRDYKATIGVDFEVEYFTIKGVNFQLQMYVLYIFVSKQYV